MRKFFVKAVNMFATQEIFRQGYKYGCIPSIPGLWIMTGSTGESA
jgi:hypothetical protein